MHFSIIKDLLKNGNFTYHTTGLLDSDHKHLFTFNEIVKMFNETGYKANINFWYLSEENKQIAYADGFMDQIYNITELPKFMFETFEYQIEAWIDNKEKL